MKNGFLRQCVGCKKWILKPKSFITLKHQDGETTEPLCQECGNILDMVAESPDEEMKDESV